LFAELEVELRCRNDPQIPASFEKVGIPKVGRIVDTAGGDEHAEHLLTPDTAEIVASPRRVQGVMAVTQGQATQVTNVTHEHPQGILRK
jgi:hypothetical protein